MFGGQVQLESCAVIGLERCGFALCALLLALSHAQLVRADERVPPRVIELPAITLPEAARASRAAAVEVLVLIDASGHAHFESSDADPLVDTDVVTAIQHALDRAHFAPATVDAVPVAARVRLRLKVVSQPAHSVTPPAPSTPPAEHALARPRAPVSEYGARARTTPVPVTAKRLTLSEMREMPGAFGDPFRVLDTLPGVVPVLSGLPYVYVRGSPPASTIYVYDDIAIPALFHLGLLNAVIHPAMLGDLDFYPSVAPARYGRKTGGVFGAEGPKPPEPGLHGELELRLIDAASMLSIPLAAGARLTVAGRYGFPGPIVHLVEPSATLAYWDYQLRLEVPFDVHDRFVLTWFGAYDTFGVKKDVVHLTFHRAELRLIHELTGLQLGAALQLGYDEASASDQLAIHGARFGPRTWLRWEPSRYVSVRVGGDMLATLGRIRLLKKAEDQRPGMSSTFTPSQSMPADAPGMPPAVVQPIPEANNSTDFLLGGPNDGQSQSAKSRNMMGVYAELNLRPAPPFELLLGARGDLWITGSAHAQAFEPRGVATWHMSDAHALHVGAGLSHQPAAFPVAVPGLADIVLDRGLQRAVQTEAGYRFDAPNELRFETSLFYNHLSELLFPELLLNCKATLTPAACAGSSFPRASADAYGWEVFLQRPAEHRLSGWLSYTLGRGSARGPDGTRFTPQFDVRHVANLVLQYDLGAGFRAGARVLYRSGRMVSRTTDELTTPTTAVFAGAAQTSQPLAFARFERRLPDFYRLDLLIAYRWRTAWGRMRLALEWLNVTFSREAVDLNTCDNATTLTTDCGYEYAPAIFVPNLGLRGDF